MSEPVAKDRPTVDLDDFERRLRQRDREHEDPLAELARLVGETSDPYDEVFAREHSGYSDRNHDLQASRGGIAQDRYSQDRYLSQRYAAQQRDSAYGHVADQGHSDYFESGDGHRLSGDESRHDAGFSDEVARRAAMSSRLAGDFASIEAGLRGTMPAGSQTESFSSDHEFLAQNELYAQQHGYAPQGQDGQHGETWPEPVAQEPARSRKSIYAMVATIAIGVIGVGVAFAYKGSSSSPSEIKTIAAASGPTKVQPPADKAADASAGQDSAMLGKGNAQPSPTRLVNGEEQPVDIGQAVQENASRTADAGTAPGDASIVPVPPAPGQAVASTDNGQPPAVAPRNEQLPSFGLTEMPPPKKVKVVSVRPDGTILPTEAAPPTNEAAPTIESVTQGTAPANAGNPAPAAKDSTSKGATPKSTSRVSAKPTQTATGETDGTAPAPKPAHKAKPKKVAALEQPTDAANSSDQAPAPAAAGAGGFAVQLAAPGSEGEAKSATSRLAKKFADALGGRHLGVHKAQSNGKSVFRVRVSSLSKDDAVSLCEKLKAAGGSCFVAKN